MASIKYLLRKSCGQGQQGVRAPSQAICPSEALQHGGALALARHALADDFRKAQRPRTSVLPVGEDEIEIGETLAAFAKRNGFQRARRQLVAYFFLRDPHEAVACARGFN